MSLEYPYDDVPDMMPTKVFLVLVLAFSAFLCLGSGECGPVKKETLEPRAVAVKYKALEEMKVLCLEGVEYWWMDEGGGPHRVVALAPKFTREGKVSTCPTELP